jgi:hypothetical protein
MARTRNLLGILLMIAVVLAAVAAACGGGGGNATGGSGGGYHADASLDGDSSAGDGSLFDGISMDTGPSGEVTSLAIDPPSATILVVDGKSTPQQLKAVATYKNGQSAAVDNAAWSVDFPSIADVDSTGKVSAKGQIGGVLTVKAELSGVAATAPITVQLQMNVNSGGVSAADQAKLEAGGAADSAVKWQYPYDGTVFPRGLAGPKLMWEGSAAGDIYEVWAKTDFVEIKAFAPVDLPARLDIPKDLWVMLTESGPGGPAHMVVRRLSGGAVSTIADQTWRLASGTMRGTVYYWSVTWGNVVRIKPGADAPDNFLGAVGVNDGCTTCHTVSADGTTLVMGNGEEIGDSKASTFDLLNNKLALSNQGRAWANPAVSADGKYVVRNHAELPGYPGAGTGDGMFEAYTGSKVAGPTGLEGRFLGMPAFSPDGSLLAYTTLPSPGALKLFDYNGAGPSVANDREIIQAGADPATQYIAWPTLTPDGKWVIYVRGDRLQQYGIRYPTGLYIASTTQPGVEMRLSNLNGDSYPFAAGDVDRLCSYEPTFAPIAAGGYFWVVFTSRRTYGSVVTYGADPNAIQQLWVAAIDQNPEPGKDPSHPAFWLYGQEPTTKNMRGFWALDPCKKLGSACGAGSECCSLICNPGDGGSFCDQPGVSQCSPVGGECKTATDCCGTGYQCINKHCTEPAPK